MFILLKYCNDVVSDLYSAIIVVENILKAKKIALAASSFIAIKILLTVCRHSFCFHIDTNRNAIFQL